MDQVIPEFPSLRSKTDHTGRGTHRCGRPVQVSTLSVAVCRFWACLGLSDFLGAENLRSSRCATANSTCKLFWILLSKPRAMMTLIVCCHLLQNFSAKRQDTGVKLLKCVEGQFSKAFLLTMSNGLEIIARLPNPNAGPAFYTIASEVATRHFVCSSLSPRYPRRS